MTLQDHAKKLLIVCNYLANFDGHSHCDSGDKILIYHVISCDHVLKFVCDFSCGRFSK